MAWDYRNTKDFKDYYEERRLQRRIAVVFVLLAAALLFYLFNLWYLQVVNQENYRRLADNNRLRQVVLNPLRGTIMDRERRVIVRNRISFNVLLDREKVTNLGVSVRTLSPVRHLPREPIEERTPRYRNRPQSKPGTAKEDGNLPEAASLSARGLELPGTPGATEP